jgi:hypothetical protein
MTVDMTNNRVPYGLLTGEEKAALHEHEKAGGGFCVTRPLPVSEAAGTSWVPDAVYRTVPLPKTQDVIAWEKLPDWAEWVSRDQDGEIYAWQDEPIGNSFFWHTNSSEYRRIDGFPGIVQIGTCDWRDSKQRRPKVRE